MNRTNEETKEEEEIFDQVKVKTKVDLFYQKWYAKQSAFANKKKLLKVIGEQRVKKVNKQEYETL